MKAGTTENVKFLRLQRRLRESKRGTVGLLEMLWHATCKNAPAGDIGAKLSNEEIATLCDWDGDHDDLVEALVEAGWLDRCKTHRLVVHDWQDHCPSYVKANNAKYRKGLARPLTDAAAEAPKEVPKEVPRDTPREAPREVCGGVSEPPTYPIQSYPSQNKVRSSRSNAPEPEGFGAWYAIFPRHQGRQDAARAFIPAIDSIRRSHHLDHAGAIALLMERTAEYAAAVKSQEPRFILLPESYLNGRRFDDEFTSGNGQGRDPYKFVSPPTRRVRS